jgi:membrane fusion protein (multidrug efflux system)
MSAEGAKQQNVVEMKSAEGGGRTAPETQARPQGLLRSRRFLLMAAVPVVLLAVGGYLWLTSGRYVSTDNAYVQQDKVTITADVAGRIVEVAVGENQLVKKGDLLFRIDSRPYEIALRQAEAAVAAARLQVEQMRATYQQTVSQLKTANDNLAYEQSNFKRQKDLLAKGVSSQANYDSSQNDLHQAEQSVSDAEQKLASARAALGGNPDIPTDSHPLVLQALAALDQAKLNLEETTVYAPADGIVAQTDRLHIGQYVTNPTGNPTALLSLVESDPIWIEANFKETDLTKMRVGQPATITFDAYPGHKLTGVVDSLGAGTGAEFSVLPAQNATGNWVKVVQRVPVRIRFDNPNGLPIRTGLSADVEVDIQADGKSGIAVGSLGVTTPAQASTETAK